MRRAVTWALVTFGVVCLVVVVGGVVYQLLGHKKLDRDALAGAVGAIAALAAVGAAVFTGIAAWAAARAAQESTATALRATEALGLAIEPRLSLRLGDPRKFMQAPTKDLGVYGKPQLTVSSASEWAASNIDIEVRAADGRTGKYSVAHLSAHETVQFDFPVPLPRPYDEPDWDDSMTDVNELIATYSDERGLLRWRLTTRSCVSVGMHEGRRWVEVGGLLGEPTVERVPLR